MNLFICTGQAKVVPANAMKSEVGLEIYLRPFLTTEQVVSVSPWPFYHGDGADVTH